MKVPLKPNGSPVTNAGITLRTPGLAGSFDVLFPAATDMRSATLSTEALEDAFAAQSMERQAAVEITETHDVDTPRTETRSLDPLEPAMEVEVPDPGPDWGQVVLAADESGVLTWHFSLCFSWRSFLDFEWFRGR